jgi:hypothetical protein
MTSICNIFMFYLIFEFLMLVYAPAASTKYKCMENSTSNSIVLFQLYKQSEGEITIY